MHSTLFTLFIFLVLSRQAIADEVLTWQQASHVKQYASHCDHQTQGALETLNRFQILGHERILEIGCRVGKMTKEIAKRVPNGLVVGIDFSPEMLKFASENCLSQEHPNIIFSYGNPESLHVKEQFDLAISFHTLQRIKDKKKAIQEIATSLKPGGRFLSRLTLYSSAYNQMMLMRKKEKWNPYLASYAKADSVNFFEMDCEKQIDEYVKSLSEAHFSLCSLLCHEREIVFENAESYLAWQIPTARFIERIPQELRKEFCQELIEGMKAAFPSDTHGEIKLQIKELEFEAIKMP